jgi:membrane fusion protein (multidrug efflux system)
MTTKKKLWIGAVLGLLLVVGLLVGIKAMQIRSMIQAGASFAPPPESVSSATVQATEWEGSRSAVASLVAIRGVTVGAEVSGTIREIGFESGAALRKGDLLVKLDVSSEEAQLQGLLADAQLARVNLKRAEQLREAGSNAPSELDAAQARAAQAEAAVATLRATIAKKIIRAPFDGRVAIRQVEVGQAVSSGTAIASIQSVTPIYADFWLPQQALVDLKPGQRVRLRVDVYPDASWSGSVTTVNPEVDPATRNVRVRATVPNADGRLKPGMFASVDVLSADKRPVLLVPATAVVFAPYGDSLFVVEKAKDASGKESAVARQRFIRAGERRGDLVAVVEGVKPGETVVSSGAFKLKNGMSVAVNNTLGPKAEVAPRPANE